MINKLVHGNLSEEVVKYCDAAQERIKKIRLDSNKPLDMATMFESSEYLLSFRAWLTSHLMQQEAMYRDKIEEFRASGSSIASAETQAKTTPEYRGYKFLQRVDDLANEQVLLVKKFSDRLNTEFQQQPY